VSGPKELTDSRGEQQFLNIQGNDRLERRHREKTVEKKKKERKQPKKEGKRVETIYDRRTILSALRHVMRNH
jgi:hypothetical protein